MTKEAVYELLLRLSKDSTVRRQFIRDPSAVLKTTGLAISESELKGVIDVLKGFTYSPLLIEQQENFVKIGLELRASVIRVVKQIEEGFKAVMKMYVVAFYVGIILFVLAGLSGLILREDILTTVFGGLGTANFIAYFVNRPPEKLQVSRGNLAQLEMAIATWFSDVHNWNAVFGQVIAEAKTEEELIQNATKISAAVISNLREAMSAIDAYCEPKEGQSKGT